VRRLNGVRRVMQIGTKTEGGFCLVKYLEFFNDIRLINCNILVINIINEE
jgi:hypothetical protein